VDASLDDPVITWTKAQEDMRFGQSDRDGTTSEYRDFA
jgi:hypothetical protein